MKHISSLILVISIFVFNLITVNCSESKSEVTSVKVRKEWGSVNGKNYACKKGSDTHCKETFGEEFCCA